MEITSYLTATGVAVNRPVFIQIFISLLFILIGNVMGRFKHNYFVGIKTPWTLANEEVWMRTHRMAAPLWVIAGILSILNNIRYLISQNLHEKFTFSEVQSENGTIITL